MAGILKARGVIYRMIIIITIKQKPEAIIFVVGVVLLTLTSGKRTKPKKTNKQKTFQCYSSNNCPICKIAPFFYTQKLLSVKVTSLKYAHKLSECVNYNIQKIATDVLITNFLTLYLFRQIFADVISLHFY